jgi:Mrp family chromosome partitioning ATPase
MSALDNAFIKAYGKSSPAQLAEGTFPAALEPAEAALTHAWGVTLTADELSSLGVAPATVMPGTANEPSHAAGVVIHPPRVATAPIELQWVVDRPHKLDPPHLDLAKFFAPTLVAAEGTLPGIAAAPAVQSVVGNEPMEQRPVVVSSERKASLTPHLFGGSGVVEAKALPQAAGPISSPHTHIAGAAAKLGVVGSNPTPTAHLLKCDGPLRPVWQVERVMWPELIDRMQTQIGRELDRLAATLAERATNGHRFVLMTSTRVGEGRTTLTLALGRRLAARGQRCLLVDGDFEHPSLAMQLTLAPEAGLEQLLSGEWPLDEVLIESIEDNLVILPLGRTLDAAQRAAGQASLARALERLRREFDVVLIDSVALEGAESREALQWLQPDAALLVHDVPSVSVEQMTAAALRLQDSGISLWGVLENHVT